MMRPRSDVAWLARRMLSGVWRRFAQRGHKAFGQRVAAEEQRGVDSIASQRVAEERKAGEITGCQTGSGFREGVEVEPDGKVGHQEELPGAGKCGQADAADGTVVAEPQADGDVDGEAGVNEGHQLMKANKDVSDE